MSNVFSFIGTVGRDAEVRYLPSGQAVLNVTVANNVGFGDKQQTLWVRVALWGKRAEGSLKDYLKKGQQVFVSGELTQREFQANDGTTKVSLEVSAAVLELVGRASEVRKSEPGASKNPQRAGTQGQPPAQSGQSHDNFDVPYDDDIPF